MEGLFSAGRPVFFDLFEIKAINIRYSKLYEHFDYSKEFIFDSFFKLILFRRVDIAIILILITLIHTGFPPRTKLQFSKRTKFINHKVAKKIIPRMQLLREGEKCVFSV